VHAIEILPAGSADRLDRMAGHLPIGKPRRLWGENPTGLNEKHHDFTLDKDSRKG
jgi:hypothetical protein